LGWVGAGCRERAGSCIEERHPLPLALALPVFPPQSRVAALGIACSTLPAGMGISATSHQSLKLARMLDEPAAPFSRRLDKETHWCLMSLRLPSPEGLTRRHIGAQPVGSFNHPTAIHCNTSSNALSSRPYCHPGVYSRY